MKLDTWIRRLAQGDRDAFRAIYEDTHDAVYYMALSILRERMHAEDVVQSAYLKVIRYAGSYTPHTNARAWILRIARNEALNLKRKYAREVQVDPDESEHLFGTHDPYGYGELIDLARMHLSDDEFRILMWIAVSGYKRREIAEILEMPIATVTWKYNRACKQLRALLRKR